jgi:hypothetical protein
LVAPSSTTAAFAVAGAIAVPSTAAVVIKVRLIP